MLCSEAPSAAAQAGLVQTALGASRAAVSIRIHSDRFLFASTPRRSNISLQLTCWFGSGSGVRRVGDAAWWFNPVRFGPHATELKNVIWQQQYLDWSINGNGRRQRN